MNNPTIYLLFLITMFLLSLWLSSFNKKYDFLFPFFHFTGGFLMAALIYGYSSKPIIIIGLVILVGLLWEFYEYLIVRIKILNYCFQKFFKINGSRPLIRDTLADLTLDLLGALFFIFLI